jgi:hypothetical protein
MLEVINPVVAGGSVAIALFLLILVSIRVGRHIGLRAMSRYGSDGMPGVGSLETAVFALLGLLIAFTFSGALNRFDIRRAQAVDEANAIGTAYLRLDLLPASEQPKVRDLFKRYVDSRIATYRLLPDVAAARKELVNSQNLQNDIWAASIVAARMSEARPDTELLLLPALNSMFDITTVRAVATQIHPPLIIYVMLIGLALASALLAGYQTAPQKGYDWMQKVGFAGIVAFTVYVILDIEYPRLGFVRIDAIDQVLVNVRAGMK